MVTGQYITFTRGGNGMSKREKVYTTLCVFFAILIAISNLTYQKFVILSFDFHLFQISSGALLYPLTFLISDLISEFYGKEKATFCIRLSMLANLLIAFILKYMDSVPATPWSQLDNSTFHHVFGFFGTAFLCSIIACYIAQAIDVILYLRIRKVTRGRYLWLRSNLSTAISLFIDTSIVIGLMTFWKILPQSQAWALIFDSYCWKLLFTLFCTPLFYLAFTLIKKGA